jgi:hypothetical protein
MIGATNVQPGPRMAGAFMRNVQVRLASPAPGGDNTSATVTLQGVNLDPFRRSGYVAFQLDRIATYSSPEAQTSANVAVLGWADVPASWASSAIGNGTWLYRARSTGVSVGAGPGLTGRYAASVSFTQSGGAGITRSLYLYMNKELESIIPAVGANARALYLYMNKAYILSLAARNLYLYVNKAYSLEILARALYLYEAKRDGEVFPWLNHISPEEQYEGGQVDLYGDGFGQYLDAQETVAPTISVSSTNGSNIADYANDRTAAEWQSTSGAAAWIRFTWGAAKRIVGIALEGSRNGTSWGIPRFRFDDASSQDGTVTVPAPSLAATTEYPVGPWRQLYWLATPKDSTYVEIAIASGGSGTNRGFAEVWIVEEIVPAQNAEPSRAWINLDYPYALDFGIVDWRNRSPGFYPANGGGALTPAATVTVPVGAVSGLVKVQEGA